MRMPTILLSAVLVAAGHHAAATAKPTCGMIDAAISSTEDFAEVVAGSDSAATAAALAAIGAGFDAVKSSLPEGKSAAVRTRIEEAKTAVARRDRSEATVAALDVYRILVGVFEPRLPTTRAVAMLDHSGFQLQGLAAAAEVDWAAIAATVKEAGENWANSKKLIKDKALLDLGDSVQTGLVNATDAKSKGWLTSLAQIQLDSVDLLERVVKNKSKGACL